MKEKRHSKILEIIDSCNIETQEDLIYRLREEGYEVTQATVSRDIRELKLNKIMGEGGKYKYILPKAGSDEDGHFAYSNALAASITSVDTTMNLVIVKTFPGMAQAVAAGLDAINLSGVMGCVAGDDTIFMAVRDTNNAQTVAASIRRISGK